VSMALAERAWCVVVPHHPRGARMARQRLVTELRDSLPPTLLADAVAVLAELVGNAVMHADPLPGGVIRVAWRLRPGGGDETPVLQVRVTDGGALEPPHIRTVAVDAIDGRGLGIVDALSARWGVERDGLGQSVWAEVSVPLQG
jgi:anti-sigma regulatory factor (Ser/Thr protein kinase)